MIEWLQSSHPNYAVQATLLKKALKQKPSLARELGACLFLAGRYDEALSVYKEAIQQTPRAEWALEGLTRTFIALEDWESGLSISNERGQTILHARCLRHLGRYQEALATLKNSTCKESHRERVYLYEALSEFENALSSCELAISLKPADTAMLASKSRLLGRLKRTEELCTWLDFRGLVSEEKLAVPSTYETGLDFREALLVQLAELAGPELVSNEEVTRHSLRIKDVFNQNIGPLDDLAELIKKACSRFVESTGFRVRFALSGNFRARLNGWSLLMHEQGHVRGHYHPKGLVSGVFYVQVATKKDSNCGCLEFGTGLRKDSEASSGPSHLVRPAGGQLVLFPSFFQHRSLPNPKGTDRVVVAFDVIPTST